MIICPHVVCPSSSTISAQEGQKKTQKKMQFISFQVSHLESEALGWRSWSTVYPLGDVGHLLNLPEPQFTHPAKGDNSISLTEFL